MLGDRVFVDPRPEAGRAHDECHQLAETLGLPFQSLNFAKRLIALAQELVALAKGNIALALVFVALIKRSVEFAQILLVLRHGFPQSHLSPREFLRDLKLNMHPPLLSVAATLSATRPLRR